MQTPKTTSASICNKKPQIDYPCRWTYKVIGKKPEVVKRAIIASCKDVPVQILPSNTSSGGTYRSFTAELTVENEEMRLSIYQALTAHPEIKLVL